MDQCNLAEWVNSEPDERIRTFREAVHITLLAIGTSPELAPLMLMKGGILLAVRYRSSRYTRDIDFSNRGPYQDFDVDAFINRLKGQLAVAVETLDYGLDCRVQSSELRPKDPLSTFPTLKIRIGYAYKAIPRSHKYLLAGQSSNTVDLDYSFNEPAPEPEFFAIGDGASVAAYSFHDLVAEKYRALLQQPERNRNRRQDVYDLHLLITKIGIHDEEEKRSILRSLLRSADSRALRVDSGSIHNSLVKEMARVDYESLRDEIDGELTEFDIAFRAVSDLYDSLPWNEGLGF